VAVSGMRNRTHAVYVMSFLRSLAEDHGRVAVTDLDGSGLLDPAAPFPELTKFLTQSPRVQLSSSSTIRAAPSHYVAVGRIGIAAWVALRRRWPRTSIAVVTTDEGLGSFASPIGRARAVRREGGSLGRVALTFLGDTFGPLIRHSEWSMFHEQPPGSWDADLRIAAEFRNLADEDEQLPPLPDVIFLTQPLPDLGLVPLEVQLARVRSFHEALTGFGWSFGVRPHPTEPRGRYGSIRTIDDDRPIELDPRLGSVKGIVGATSTALLTVSATWGVPTFRDVALTPPGSLSSRERSLLAEFVTPVDGARDLVNQIKIGR
jgi:hypothetical protein